MNKKKDWFKVRGYTHLTNNIPIHLRQRVYRKVSNPKYVSKHSFSPLLFKEIKQRRYKEFKDNGELRRSHKKIKNGKFVSNTKIRKILYASHMDANIYSYYAQKIIQPKYESFLKQDPDLSSAVTAYRQILTKDKKKFKNNIHFAKEVFDEIKKRGECVVLAFDIENFFPSLNHKKLKNIWANILGLKSLTKDHYNIFKSVTNFSYIKLSDLKSKNYHFDEKKLSSLRKEGHNSFFKNVESLLDSGIRIYKNQRITEGNKIGIPQGLPISSVLANIYMFDFDKSIVNELVKIQKCYYRRYSDDIIVVCAKENVISVKEFIHKEIKKIELQISEAKTEEIHFKLNEFNELESFRLKNTKVLQKYPLKYLGFEFHGQKILIKSSNLASFYRDMKDSIRVKNRRIEKIKEKYLLDNAPIFKRKIYRLFSYKGIKKRTLKRTKNRMLNGKSINIIYHKKYRGNYIKYALLASEEMKSPEIKRQLRNHWKILQLELKKYDFSNVKKGK